MFPRLFRIYFPNFHLAVKSVRKSSGEILDPTELSDESPSLIASDVQTDSMEDDDLLLTTNLTSSLWKNSTLIKTFDCFMFEMLFCSASKNYIQADHEHSMERLELDNQLADLSSMDKLRRHYFVIRQNIKKNSNLQSLFVKLSEFIMRERNSLIKNFKEVFKATLSIESHTYSNNFGLKEVSIASRLPVKNRVQKFFRQFAEHAEGYLLEILMIAPDSLNNLCKIL